MLDPVVTLSVDVAPGAGLGLKAPAAPVGRPLTLKLTALVNPLTAAMFTVKLVPAPTRTVWLTGETVRLKSGTGGTVLTAKFCVNHCAYP